MKKNKKANEVMLTTLLSIIIFVIFFTAIVLKARAPNSNAETSLLILNAKDALIRVQKVPEATEVVEIKIRKNSMIIGYAPGHEILLSRFEAREAEMKFTHGAGVQYISSGIDYVFPKPDGTLKGTFQEGNPNFFGYVKQRAPNCPTSSFCLCECSDFELVTNPPDSTHRTERAHIKCGVEQCQIVPNVTMDGKIYLKDFIKFRDFSEIQNHHPDPNKMFWEGGFIIVKSEKYEIGNLITQICYKPSKYQGDKATWSWSSKCRDDEEPIVIKKSIIAGNTESYMADIFNLKIINTGAGTIRFEAI